MRVPYQKNLFNKHAFAYVAVQVVLWIKLAIFYFTYGSGILSRLPEPTYTFAPLLAPQVFATQLLAQDWLFHQTIHLALLVLFFLFARRVKKFDFKLAFPLVFVADVLHNVGYWLTNSFPTFIDLTSDFAKDFLLMAGVIWIFIYLFSNKRTSWLKKLLPASW